MSNVIYRGPTSRQPATVNLPVAGAYLPGIFVTSDDAELTQATTAIEKQLFLLSNSRFLEQDIATAYAADDSAVAYEVLPGEKYQARMAAATYAVGDPLTVDSDGRLAAAGAASVVVAYFRGTAGAHSAGDFADVDIANGSAGIA